MIGHLYRYPHPTESGKWVYVGQGPKRDSTHRRGNESFGRRFKKQFPGIELPQPVRESVDVENQLELNELETLWMFIYHTWHGYENGMNLTLPGSQDYKNAAVLQSKEEKARAGRIAGLKNAKSGQLAYARSKYTSEHRQKVGYSVGIENAKLRRGVCGRSLEKMSEDGRKGGLLSGQRNVDSGQAFLAGKEQGRKNSESGHMSFLGKSGAGPHTSKHINRNRPNPRCILCSEQSLIVAYA